MEMLLKSAVSKQLIIFYTETKRIIRSSDPEVFCKKDVLKNFTKFTGKHLCWNICFNKVASLRPGTLLKERFQHGCLPVNFTKFLRTPFFTEHLSSCFWMIFLISKIFKADFIYFCPNYSRCCQNTFVKDGHHNCSNFALLVLKNALILFKF